MNKRISYGIRKLSIGLASVAIASIFIGKPVSVQAEQRTMTAAADYRINNIQNVNLISLSYDDLTESEKGLIRSKAVIDVTEQTYLLIYQPTHPKTQGFILPKTSSIREDALLIAGIGSLGILLLVSHKKRNKYYILLLGLTISGSLSTLINAEAHVTPLSVSTVKVDSSQLLSIAKIDGYEYIGFISLSDLPSDSFIRTLVNSSFTETSTQLLSKGSIQTEPTPEISPKEKTSFTPLTEETVPSETEIVQESSDSPISPVPSPSETEIVQEGSASPVPPVPSPSETEIVQESSDSPISPVPSPSETEIVQEGSDSPISPVPSPSETEIVQESSDSSVSPVPSPSETEIVQEGSDSPISPVPSPSETEIVQEGSDSPISPVPSPSETEIVQESSDSSISPVPSPSETEIVQESSDSPISPVPSPSETEIVQEGSASPVPPVPSPSETEIVQEGSDSSVSPVPSPSETEIVQEGSDSSVSPSLEGNSPQVSDVSTEEGSPPSLEEEGQNSNQNKNSQEGTNLVESNQPEPFDKEETEKQAFIKTSIEKIVKNYKELTYYSEEIYRAAGYRNKLPDYSHLEELQLESSFEKVKEELAPLFDTIVKTSVAKENIQEQEDYLLAHKASILLGLAYLDRWYSVPLTDKHLLKDSILESIQQSPEPLTTWLVKLGNGPLEDPYLPQNNAYLFEYAFTEVTNSPTIYEFLKKEVKSHQPNKTFNEWFKQTSKAYIVEKQPQSIPMSIEIVERLNQPNLQNSYLPLLTMTSPSLYIIPTATTLTFGDMATYIEEHLKQTDPITDARKQEELKHLIDKHAQYQIDHLDFWYRIAKDNVKHRLLNGSVLVFDSLLQQTKKQWAEKTGPNSTTAVKEVLLPAGRYHRRTLNADAFSNGDLIQFSETPILRDDLAQGGSIWTHELVHALEDKVYLGGYGLRPGVGQESYAEGLFQTIRDRNAGSIGFNLYSTLTDEEKKRLSTVNTSPNRFQNAQDLKKYMHHLFDVLYVLDLAEGKAFLNLSDFERGHLIGRMVGIKDTDSNNHTDQVIEASDVNTKLRTINDLVDHQIVIKRHDFRGKVSIIRGPSADRNTYVSVPLFSPMFGLLENPQGASGGYTFRRVAFELLAHKGYEEGMIPYISDQFASQAKSEGKELSDQYIVQHIFKDDPTINSLSDFKKAMFREREEKRSALKPITITYENKTITLSSYTDIEKQMKDALKKDSIRMWRNQGEAAGHVYHLKQAIFKAYLEATNEFQQSIFSSDE